VHEGRGFVGLGLGAPSIGSVSTRRFVTSLAVLAAMGLLVAAGCGEQTSAIRVGDQSVSQTDFQDELDALAALAGDAPGEYPRGALRTSYDQGFVTQVANQRVYLMIFAQIFDDEGLEITTADRAQVRAELERDPAFLELPESYREMIVEDLAKQQVVQTAIEPAALREAAEALLETTGISSRVGSWDDVEGVVRPQEPLRQNGDEAADDLLVPAPEG
jgi:hypothetical protein